MSVKLSCLPQSKALLSLYDDISEVGGFDRIITPVSRSIDLLNDTLYNKCVDKLTGGDNLESLLNDIMNMPIRTNTGAESFINTKDIEFRFEPEPYKHPAYLDRSYMISIDVTQLP